MYVLTITEESNRYNGIRKIYADTSEQCREMEREDRIEVRQDENMIGATVTYQVGEVE